MTYLEKLLDGARVEWQPLEEIGEFIRGNGLQKKDFIEDGFPAIHYGQIYTRYGLCADKTFTYIAPELAHRLRKAQKDDLLFTTTSENDADVVKPLAWLGGQVAISGHMMLFRHEQNVKYLAYFFQTEAFQKQKRDYITGTKVRRVSSQDLAKIKIPIPCPENPQKSLKIQGEIVRILDKFSASTRELQTELARELELRKKQYAFYRDKLLTFPQGDVEWKNLEEMAKIKHGRDWKNLKAGTIPVYGSGGIMGYVDSYTYDKPTVLIPRKGSITNIFYVDTPFWNVDTIYYTEIDTAKLIPKYLYHFIKTIDLMRLDTGSGRPSLTQAILNKLAIPIPCPDNSEKSLAEQTRIVAILDRFETLTNSLQEGLPREITLRKKQYAYYRDMLFNFPKS